MPRRKNFEGFGGLKGVVNAAGDGRGPDYEITFRNSGTGQPDGADAAAADEVTPRHCRKP